MFALPSINYPCHVIHIAAYPSHVNTFLHEQSPLLIHVFPIYKVLSEIIEKFKTFAVLFCFYTFALPLKKWVFSEGGGGTFPWIPLGFHSCILVHFS